jgi:hypothetical protein
MLLASSLATSASGQYSLVKSIDAQTADGLLIRLWPARQTVIDGKPIVIGYRIQNSTSKAIHIVWDQSPDITVDRGTIAISVPYVVSGGHKEYNYRFVKVAAGKWVSGRLEIPPDKYHGSTIWDIQVGFGYVTNIKDLDRRPLPSEDPAQLMGLLGSRLRTFALGYLSVKVD